MDIATYDKIPNTSSIASYIENIAVFDNLDNVKYLKLPARIDFFLSILCEKGSININYDNSSVTLTSNCLLVMRAGHVINSYNTSSDFKGHCIAVSAQIIDETATALSKILPYIAGIKENPTIQLTPKEAATQIELCNILRSKAYSHGHSYQKEVTRGIIEALFYETLGLYNDYFSSDIQAASLKRRNALLQRFIAEVEKNFHSHRSVAFYANELCVTPKYLSASVKETSGKTAGEWIDSYVILEAKTLLRNTGLTVQEVSNKLNFSNQSFFGKYFKHLTGISPRKFRNQSIG